MFIKLVCKRGRQLAFVIFVVPHGHLRDKDFAKWEIFDNGQLRKIETDRGKGEEKDRRD